MCRMLGLQTYTQNSCLVYKRILKIHGCDEQYIYHGSALASNQISFSAPFASFGHVGNGETIDGRFFRSTVGNGAVCDGRQNSSSFTLPASNAASSTLPGGGAATEYGDEDRMRAP